MIGMNWKTAARRVGALMLVLMALGVAGTTAAAEDLPWKLKEVKNSKEVEVRPGVVVSDGTHDYLFVTVQYEKAPAANALRAAKIIDKSNKNMVVGRMFNQTAAKDDPKTVTFIFVVFGSWGGVAPEYYLQVSGHEARVRVKR